MATNHEAEYKGPVAETPPFLVVSSGAPISLYDSIATIKHTGLSLSTQCKIDLDWLPFPIIRCTIPYFFPPLEFRNALLPLLFKTIDDLEIELEDGSIITDSTFHLGMRDEGSGKLEFKLKGCINQLVIRNSKFAMQSACCLIVNFEGPTDEPIKVGAKYTRQRTKLQSDKWSILIDPVHCEPEPEKHLRSNSGFAVTLVAKIESSNHLPFSIEDVNDLSVALNWYLSFANGRWVGPCLIKGFGLTEDTTCESWQLSRIEIFRNCRSWMNGHPNGQFSGPFPGFMKWWDDKDWREVLTNAIHWYIEANNQAGSVEGAIVLTQTAFELLASVILVEREKILSSDGFERLPAADRLRLLFGWVKLPMSIPPILKRLTAICKEENCMDVPGVLTSIRNTITHPTKKNRDKFDKHTDESRLEAWCLGLWALELCILRLCEYNGTYSNRIIHTNAWEAEKVPWVK